MLHSLGTVLSAEATTGGLQTWIKSNVIPLLLLVIAVMLFVVAQRGDNAKAMKVVAGVVIALGVLGLATGGRAEGVGTWLLLSSRGEVVRLPVDDEIYQVNGVWLGPPGKTLPWRARYVAYAVGVVIFVVLQAVERRLGIGFGFFSVAYSLLVTVGLTRLVLKVVDHDRSVASVVTAFVHEVSAPREDLGERRFTFRPLRVPAVDPSAQPDGVGKAKPSRRAESTERHC